MSEIEVGDIVRRKRGVGFSGGIRELEEFEVVGIDDYYILDKENSYHGITNVEFVRKGNKAVSKFSNVIKEVPNPKRKIVAGKIILSDDPNPTIYIGSPTNSNSVNLSIDSQYYSVTNLRELAELANELADVLEGT